MVTCVITRAGRVACFGRDALNAEQTHGPTIVPELESARALFASGGATCAETAAGLRCFGDNIFGQVHMPPTLDFELPGTPSAEWQGAARGALGPEGACVVRDRVFCWGEVGSSLTPSDETRFGTIAAAEQQKNPISGARIVMPHAVPGIDGATSVTFGVTHLCALMHHRTVRCLGENGVGQLGRATSTLDGSFAAAAVEGLRDVVQIEAGLAATCALTESGEVHCWGSNYFGHLGVANESSLGEQRRRTARRGNDRTAERSEGDDRYRGRRRCGGELVRSGVAHLRAPRVRRRALRGAQRTWRARAGAVGEVGADRGGRARPMKSSAALARRAVPRGAGDHVASAVGLEVAARAHDLLEHLPRALDA